MTREDVIRMAGEAGFNLHHNPELYDCMVADYKSIERFAALVAAAEREACADIAEDEIKRVKPTYSPTADIISRRIRERGQS